MNNLENRLTHKINNKCVLWYHDINDNNWDLNSYKKIVTINNYEDLLICLKNINNIECGMFFVMKENITPIWENEYNKNGGYWSFKINKNNAYNVWIELFYNFCFNKLSSDDTQINGFSISPKFNNCIFKIWNNDKFNKDLSFLNNNLKYLNISDGLYKSY